MERPQHTYFLLLQQQQATTPATTSTGSTAGETWWPMSIKQKSSSKSPNHPVLPTPARNLGATSFPALEVLPSTWHKPPAAPGRALRLKNKGNKPPLAQLSFFPAYQWKRPGSGWRLEKKREMETCFSCKAGGSLTKKEAGEKGKMKRESPRASAGGNQPRWGHICPGEAA